MLEGYPESAAVGASRLKEILRKHTDACPEQKIVLLGYSQGAQVVGDAIAGGGGGEMGPITAGMEQNLIDRSKLEAATLHSRNGMLITTTSYCCRSHGRPTSHGH